MQLSADVVNVVIGSLSADVVKVVIGRRSVSRCS